MAAVGLPMSRHMHMQSSNSMASMVVTVDSGHVPTYSINSLCCSPNNLKSILAASSFNSF